MVSSSRLALLALVAVVAVATSVMAQTCVVSVTDYGSDSTCATPTTTVAEGSGVCTTFSQTYQYLQADCNSFNDPASSWTVAAWASSQGGCTGGYAGRASGTGINACATWAGGSSVATTSYFKVNCSCSSILPAVSSSSSDPVSSSSSTGLASSSSAGSTGVVIDTGCPRRVNTYSASGCATEVATYTPYSQACSPFASFGGTQYYVKLICSAAVANSNWQATVFASSLCTGTVAASATSDSTFPNQCTSAPAVGTTFYLNVNCSCDGGRRYSSSSAGAIGSSSTGATSMTSMTSQTSQTSVTSATTIITTTGSSSTGARSSTGSSTTGTSSAPVSRSAVVAIVAAVAAGAVALMA